ncbi:Uu.00g133160.m01.CDS01 [Anthostomella pinea]|uniref:Uu.00g133160.m01.CDS01 n=1 Tax=Anthostomella pinea TaxID=933095 RepID=A0AAI8VSZ1_9PEZI|nr:Uu.00g133160.m01.CDS01 [Anthostomella pinea]
MSEGKSNGNVPDISIALKPCDLSSVGTHAEKISKLASNISEGDDTTRIELVETARKLVRALETPRETMIKHCWAQPAAMTALTVGVDVGLFRVMAKDNGSSKKASELAKAVGVDIPVIARLLRHLGAMGYVIETGVDEYRPTDFTNSLCIPIIAAGYPVLSGGLLSALNQFSDFLGKTEYKTPQSMSDGPLQYAYNTKLNMFEHLQWMDEDFFPVKELIDGADTSDGSAFLVDIGGSTGHDIEEFLQKHPNAPGRLILEDLPVVIGQIESLDEKIERVPHDFYTEQPVCMKVLARITEAMKPGYSKLLINENVIPGRNAAWEATGLDILMMTLLAAKERTEQDWHDLLGAAGLKINKIWTVANGTESLIECELA